MRVEKEQDRYAVETLCDLEEISVTPNAGRQMYRYGSTPEPLGNKEWRVIHLRAVISIRSNAAVAPDNFMMLSISSAETLF